METKQQSEYEFEFVELEVDEICLQMILTRQVSAAFYEFCQMRKVVYFCFHFSLFYIFEGNEKVYDISTLYKNKFLISVLQY